MRIRISSALFLILITVAAPAGEGWREVPYMDAYLGIPAATLRLPPGWEFEGGVLHAGESGESYFLTGRAWDSSTGEHLDIYPKREFTYSAQPLPGLPPALRAYLKPPLRAADALQILAAPYLEKGGWVESSGVEAGVKRRLDQEYQQEAALYAMGNSYSPLKFHPGYDTGYAVVQYRDGGKTMTEILIVQMHYLLMQSPYSGDMVTWSFAAMTCGFPADKYEAFVNAVKTAQQSIQVNPAWRRQCDFLTAQHNQRMIAGMNKKTDDGWKKVMEDIRSTGEYVRNSMAERHKSRMESWDRIAKMREETTFQTYTAVDPRTGGEISGLNNMYKYAWINENNIPVYTDDSTYNPNVGPDNRSTWVQVR